MAAVHAMHPGGVHAAVEQERTEAEAAAAGRAALGMCCMYCVVLDQPEAGLLRWYCQQSCCAGISSCACNKITLESKDSVLII